MLETAAEAFELRFTGKLTREDLNADHPPYELQIGVTGHRKLADSAAVAKAAERIAWK